MHKSALIFGLLASSLVMLAIMPFLNQNNSFSNVMAQEYDKYGDSSYSTYQTDDKKYECQTGPFEGFFVSSVEFCKHVKFDNKDRKDISRDDNRTGIQGPQGPQGETGATGATGATGMQGPPGEDGMDGAQGLRGFNGTNGIDGTQGQPGITQLINGTNVYLVARSEDATSASIDVTAPCEAGDFVINGGYFINGFSSDSTLVPVNGPIISPPGEGWRTVVSGVPTEPNIFTELFVNAFCFDNSP
jgi:integrin beta 3